MLKQQEELAQYELPFTGNGEKLAQRSAYIQVH